MRLPRNVSAEVLIKKLCHLGYNPTRQSGSPIRLTHKSGSKELHITIPNHNPIRIGTLSEIIRNVASQLDIPKEDLIRQLFK